jgi:hypothetical protein
MRRFSDKLENQSERIGEMCLGVLDGETQDEKFEVVLRRQEQRPPSIELRLVRWGEGVGWYVQRTTPLPADLCGLRGLLRRAQRIHASESPQARPQANARGRVIALPRP